MASVNKVILVGNLGRDPEVRYQAGGAPVAAQAQPTRRELDMAMLIKNLARQVRRAEPYGTNYHRISDDALDALKRWGLDGSPVRTTKPEGTQSQQVDKSTEMQRQLVDRTPDLHRQQQPVSGADQFRDAAQMIEPSGNSGGLPVSVRDALDWYAQQVGNCRRFGPAGDAARADLDADGGRRARAALAQQDDDALTVDDYKKVLADSDRLIAELGRLLMVDDAPTQPRLCDLVSFALNEGVVLAGKQDADKEDAERYRYLRGYRGHKATGVLLKGILFNGHESLARTDEAIDAASKEKGA